MWECCGKIHLPLDRLTTFHLFSKAPAYSMCELIPFKVRDRNPKAPSAQRAALLPRMLEMQPFSWPNPPPQDTLLLLVFIFTSTKSILLLRCSSKSSSHFVTHLLSSLTLKQRVIGGFSWGEEMSRCTILGIRMPLNWYFWSRICHQSSVAAAGDE